MTIAIGIMANDGIVIAADTQITVGSEKFNKGKWSGIYCSDPRRGPDGKWHVYDPGSLVVAGAALPAGYLYNAADALRQEFQANKSLMGDDLRSRFQQVLSDFHEAHVIPYLPLPADERPVVDLVIGYSRNSQERLLENELSTVNDAAFFTAAGVGKASAHSMLETLYRVPPLSLSATVLLASLVVTRVKKTSIYVGNATDIVCVKDNGFWWARREWTKEAEDIWDEYGRLVEAVSLRALLDEPLPPESAKLRALRRRVRQLAQSVEASQAKPPTPSRSKRGR